MRKRRREGVIKSQRLAYCKRAGARSFLRDDRETTETARREENRELGVIKGPPPGHNPGSKVETSWELPRREQASDWPTWAVQSGSGAHDRFEPAIPAFSPCSLRRKDQQAPSMDSAMQRCDRAVKLRLGSRRLAPERHLRHGFAICLGRCGNHPVAHHQGLARPVDDGWGGGEPSSKLRGSRTAVAFEPLAE
jgi:hypothetical protein